MARGAYMDERSARAELCEYARDIWTRGLGAAGDGNLSVRIGADSLLTTPSGCHKGRLRPADIVLCDLRGQPIRAGKPSSEIAMHLEAYRRRPDVKAVIHAHPPMATAYNLAGGRLSEILVSEVVFAFGQVASAPYTTPTTLDVPTRLGDYFTCYDAVMMARHGSVTLGESLERAFLRLDALEHTAKVLVAARAIGGASPLPEAEVDRLFEVATGGKAPPYRRPGNACPPLESHGTFPGGDEAIVAAVLDALATSRDG